MNLSIIYKKLLFDLYDHRDDAPGNWRSLRSLTCPAHDDFYSIHKSFIERIYQAIVALEEIGFIEVASIRGLSIHYSSEDLQWVHMNLGDHQELRITDRGRAHVDLLRLKAA